LVLAGGVAANSYLRSELTKACADAGVAFSYPRISYCTDNGAMVGAAAYYAYKKGITADLTLNAVAVESFYNEP
jgi:N6-L-threonylcarbamoyladenine synthase